MAFMKKQEHDALWENIKAAATELGVNANNLKIWKQRRYVPPRWWHEMEARGYAGVDRDSLWELWNENKKGGG